MAVQYNQVNLGGHLTRDPELRFTNSGIPVCNFGLAVNRRGNNDDVDFFDVTVWRDLGETVANYMKKGSAVLIGGRIEFQQYQDRQGNKRSKHIIVANEVQFLDRKSDGNGGGSSRRSASDQELEDATGYSRTRQGAQRAQQRTTQRQAEPPDLNEEDYDDIPF